MLNMLKARTDRHIEMRNEIDCSSNMHARTHEPLRSLAGSGGVEALAFPLSRHLSKPLF